MTPKTQRHSHPFQLSPRVLSRVVAPITVTLVVLATTPIDAANRLSDLPVVQLAAKGAVDKTSALGRYLAGRAARRHGR